MSVYNDRSSNFTLFFHMLCVIVYFSASLFLLFFSSSSWARFRLTCWLLKNSFTEEGGLAFAGGELATLLLLTRS